MATGTRETEPKKRLFDSQNRENFEISQTLQCKGLPRFWLYNRNPGIATIPKSKRHFAN
jgi:hypothetical protein